MPKKSIFDKYETYDPSVEGYGNPQQWQEAFSRVVSKITPIDEARKLLGVTKSSTLQEIKSAYRLLAFLCHPDKFPDKITTFQNLNSAYKVVLESLYFTTSKPIKQSAEIKPQLLNEIEESEVEKYINDPHYCAQEKHDGERRLLKFQSGITQGINKKGLFIDCLDIFKNSCNEIAAANNLSQFLLDGEEVKDTLYVFDFLSLNEIDLRSKTYAERFAKEVLINISTLSIKAVSTAYTTQEKRDLYNSLKANNKEGIVFKLLSGIHVDGNSDDWVKFKFYATASVIVIKQNVKNSVAIAVMEGDNLIPVGNVTCKGHDKPTVGEIIEVRYLYAYRGGSLYQPNLIGKRNDMDKEDCTIEKLKFKLAS